MAGDNIKMEYTWTEEVQRINVAEVAISIMRLDAASPELKKKANEYLKLVLDVAIGEMQNANKAEV